MRAGLIESDGFDWFSLAERIVSIISLAEWIVSILVEDTSGEKKESPRRNGRRS